MMMRIAVLLMSFLSASDGQSQPPQQTQSGAPAATAVAMSFEAASIRPSKSERLAFLPPRLEGTRLRAENAPVDSLIMLAYGVRATELVGGPGWVREEAGERYDVLATAARGSTRDEQLAMLRRLLEERFSLRVHRETRQMPIYVLTAERTGETIGPNLRRAAKDCSPRSACEGFVTLGRASSRGGQWSSVVQTIAAALDRRLVDRTGFSGTFDFDLEYAPRLSATPDDQRPDIFTAVTHQLGLKLQPETTPMEVTVIDAVSRPTAN